VGQLGCPVAAAQSAILTGDRKPDLRALTVILKNRVQTPIDDRAVLSTREGNDKITAIVN